MIFGRAGLCGLLMVLAACDAGHLGAPLLWPVEAGANALSNAAYDQRRREVKRLLTERRAAIRARDPEALAALWRASGVPPAARAAALRDLAASPDDQDWPESATIAVMVRSR